MPATLREARVTDQVTAAANITVNLPASVQTGDYVLISLVANGGTITTALTGWTLIDSELVQSNPKHAVWGRLRVGGDPATVVITKTNVASTAIALAIQGVDQTTPVDVISTGGTNSTGSTTMTAADMTTLTANTLLVLFGGINSTSQTIGPGTSGMTEVAEVTTASAKRQAAYTEARAATGATGTRTVVAGSGSLAWTAIMLAIRSAAATTQRRRLLMML